MDVSETAWINPCNPTKLDTSIKSNLRIVVLWYSRLSLSTSSSSLSSSTWSFIMLLPWRLSRKNISSLRSLEHIFLHVHWLTIQFPCSLTDMWNFVDPIILYLQHSAFHISCGFLISTVVVFFVVIFKVYHFFFYQYCGRVFCHHFQSKSFESFIILSSPLHSETIYHYLKWHTWKDFYYQNCS